MERKIVTPGMLKEILRKRSPGLEREIGEGLVRRAPDNQGVNWDLREADFAWLDRKSRKTLVESAREEFNLTSKDAEPVVEKFVAHMSDLADPVGWRLLLDFLALVPKGENPGPFPIYAVLGLADRIAGGDTITIEDMHRAARVLMSGLTSVPNSQATSRSIKSGAGDMLVIADLDVAPTDFVAEGMAALDELQRAFGGGGFVVRFSHTGSEAIAGVTA